VYRLRKVLGRRTGHERPPPDQLSRRQRSEQGSENIIELPDRARAASDAALEVDTDDEADDPLATGLAGIEAADSSFNPEDFSSGARNAFEMVIQAFADGDQKTLRGMLNDEVFDNFGSEIERREGLDNVLETTLIGIKSSEILEARMEARIAFITVKFVSEQVNVTRDRGGEVIEGDPNHVANVTDIWTFARNTRARDPNWTLVETRSQN
jgi:predicted lipid-binding transport protein (Tim44 family)